MKLYPDLKPVASFRTDLLDLLRKRAYVAGEHKLASGKTSTFYIDCRRVSLTNRGQWLISHTMLSAIRTHLPATYQEEHLSHIPYVGAIAGEGVGGSAIAIPTAMQSMTLPTLLIRPDPKEHGASKGKQIEGTDNVMENANVVLCEDVITSGNSVLKAASVLREAGYNVVLILALVDRLEGGRERITEGGFRLETIFTRKDFVEENEENWKTPPTDKIPVELAGTKDVDWTLTEEEKKF